MGDPGGHGARWAPWLAAEDGTVVVRLSLTLPGFPPRCLATRGRGGGVHVMLLPQFSHTAASLLYIKVLYKGVCVCNWGEGRCEVQRDGGPIDKD